MQYLTFPNLNSDEKKINFAILKQRAQKLVEKDY